MNLFFPSDFLERKYLVAHEDFDAICICRVQFYFSQPCIRQRFETVSFTDVVHEDDALSTAIIRRRQRSEPLLDSIVRLEKKSSDFLVLALGRAEEQARSA